MDVLCLGDSHTLVFKMCNNKQKRWKFNIVEVPGATAQGAVNPHSKTDALRILISSISLAVLIPIDHEIALTFISSAISSLLFSEIFFESFRLDIECFLPNITAAAKTGPAMGPLPASSTPASII